MSVYFSPYPISLSTRQSSGCRPSFVILKTAFMGYHDVIKKGIVMVYSNGICCRIFNFYITLVV